MKGVVGFLFFMLFLAGFALVLLQGRQSAEVNLGAGAASWAGADWRLVTIGAETVAPNSELTVRFVAVGGVTGFAGCNEFSGSLQRTGTQLVVGPLRSTRRACADEVMQREAEFLKALESTASIEAEAGELRITDANGERLLLLRRVADP